MIQDISSIEQEGWLEHALMDEPPAEGPEGIPLHQHGESVGAERGLNRIGMETELVVQHPDGNPDGQQILTNLSDIHRGNIHGEVGLFQLVEMRRAK